MEKAITVTRNLKWCYRQEVWKSADRLIIGLLRVGDGKPGHEQRLERFFIKRLLVWIFFYHPVILFEICNNKNRGFSASLKNNRIFWSLILIPHGCVVRRLNNSAVRPPRACCAGVSTPENVNLFLSWPLVRFVHNWNNGIPGFGKMGQRVSGKKIS